MTQEPLFVEDIYEALRAIGNVLGGSKKVGLMLWPDKTADKAGELWANCLNRTRPEKLDPEQVLFILKLGREHNCHVGMHFICQETDYKYEPIDPEDEKTKVQREYIQCTKHLMKLGERIEKLEGKQLKAVGHG